jgi:hypothetical protein
MLITTPEIGAECYSPSNRSSITSAVFPQRSLAWPISQLRADWAFNEAVSLDDEIKQLRSQLAQKRRWCVDR